MNAISPDLAGSLADVILTLHVGIVAFVVLGEAAILLGARRGWRWVRNFALRAAHLALVTWRQVPPRRSGVENASTR